MRYAEIGGKDPASGFEFGSVLVADIFEPADWGYGFPVIAIIFSNIWMNCRR